MILAISLLVAGASDPRPELIELQLQGRHEAAVAAADTALVADPETARSRGLEYLRAHLRERLRQNEAAARDFAAAIEGVPLLADYGRYRLALNQYRSGHPERAVALLAAVLGDTPPRALLPAIVRALADSLAGGGLCDLLPRLDTRRLDTAQRRILEVSEIDCLIESADLASARERLIQMLRRSRRDDSALAAAERLARLTPDRLSAETCALLGLTFHHHRDFGRAVTFLECGLPAAGDVIGIARGIDAAEVEYALARSHFWQGDYATAATRFQRLAEREREHDAVTAARAFFQTARCRELQGDWPGAVALYRQVHEIDLAGSWASAAALAALRLEWRQGREEEAVTWYRRLQSRSSWRRLTARGTLFLLASDTVRRRSDRARRWLTDARRYLGDRDLETDYWQGRLAELQGDIPSAARSYAAILTRDHYHPLAQAALLRLRASPVAEILQGETERWAVSTRFQEQLAAWLLSSDDDPSSRELRDRLASRLARESRARTFLDMQVAPPQDWPIWHRRPPSAEDLLLTLGIVEQPSSALSRSLPLANASVALARSQLLAAQGLHRESIRVAEVLRERQPSDLPDGLLPAAYRRLLYPRPFRDLVENAARRFDVDADLIDATIREESRFDPAAVSPASARGLAQLVFPTARRTANRLGVANLATRDLHDPETSITLGAAYLAELTRRFEGRTLPAIAAYNAGEDQARLWQSYCFSLEPEEYLSKVGFRETRAYLERVASSRAQYREIYGESPSEAAGEVR